MTLWFFQKNALEWTHWSYRSFSSVAQSHHLLLELTVLTHVQWVGNAIQPPHLLSSPSPPAPQSLPASESSNESTLHMRWPKYWSFSFSISPSSEYSGLISFRIDLFDLLAVQGTLKSLLQHCSKASVLWHSDFVMVKVLTRWTFVRQVMSLVFNMLSRLVIAFPPRSKHLLISWLQSPSAVILEPRKIKSDTFHCFPIYLP